jgi:Asp-tRNA(Asn)/Glu-tRNA(Gln) amidotransferase A subunit family amidase
MPVSSVTVDSAELPVGLSLLGSAGEDLFLLHVVQQVAAAMAENC